jgi:hypothetical protein
MDGPTLCPGAESHTKTTLTDLSDDLLHDIAGFAGAQNHIPEGDCPRIYQSRHLFNLALCSRRLHMIVEPLLYREFYETRSYEIATGKIVRALLYFMRTVLARPDLALRVRAFHGCASYSENLDGSIDVSMLRPEDWKRTRDAICAVEEDSDRVEEWARAVDCGSWDAITALTIWQLPNLQELTFERWEISNSFYPFVVGFLFRFRPLDHLKPCLQHLRIMDHSKLPRYYLPDWVERPCVSLAGFEKLQYLEIQASVLFVGAWESDEESEPNLSLTELLPYSLEELVLSSVHEQDMQFVLDLIRHKEKCAPALKRLNLGWMRTQYPDRSSLGPYVHHKITQEQMDRMLVECEKAGVEMVVRLHPPEQKTAQYPTQYDLAVDGRDFELYATKSFAYPYEGYEQFCEDNGCDPATGFPNHERPETPVYQDITLRALTGDGMAS